MAWEVEYTDEFETWWEGLDQGQQELLTAAVEQLEQRGPTLGRPYVDTIQGSNIHNLKELRADDGTSYLRTLFVFDPRRTAILLIGGDKTGRFDAFYTEGLPEAERLYDEHIAQLKKEGLI